MLVLSRRRGEEIKLVLPSGEVITVVVKEKTAVGIDAPRNVQIVRGEIYQRPLR